MFAITKELYFCYGHRLMAHSGKCRHLHGHSVKVAVTVIARDLDHQEMVCDFADISGRVSPFIEAELDHNLLLHRDDPLIPLLDQAGERYRALDGHPTAEYLARLIFLYAKSAGLNVYEVVLWETASAYARYAEPQSFSQTGGRAGQS